MKWIKKIGITLIVLLVLGFIGMKAMKYMTKRHSPEETVTHVSNGTNFSVFYNRPYKKGRVIFGELVPFGEVWRTGANEATTFTIDSDVMIDGSILKAGTYTLWTIPNPESWKIIFNSKSYDWGIGWDSKVKREAAYDVLTIEKPVLPLLNAKEQFSIYFEEANNFTLLYLAWDTTAIAIPMTIPNS